ncbi:hypothetical protein DFJ74DRAFT_678901 [Hyaloraphidium curvatum]|nr:hypothetical protein DFJ74DRAFT_678901 [Hyaloraphidium curvatum]
MAADLVIRGGTVVDGSGAAPFRADVAVKGGVISAIGPDLPAGAKEIDAHGKLVTPGFVDVHCHYDGQIVWDSQLNPSSLHGVTTAVVGNCGVGFAPVRPGSHNLLIELMEGIEDIPAPVMAEGLDFSWETFSEFLDKVASKKHDIDICTLVPHAAVRVYVMGERAVKLEKANETDIQEMRRIVADAIKAGAFGFSTSRTLNHKTLKGDPTPTLRAAEDELSGIAAGMKEVGAGIIELVSDWFQPKEEFDILKRVAESSGRPALFLLTENHDDPKKKWKTLLQLSDDAAAQGVPIRPVFPPRAVGVLLGLLGSANPFVGTATFKTIAHLPLEEKVARMRDPEVRRKILSEDRRAGITAFPALKRLQFNRMFPFGSPPDYTPPPDASVAAIAAREKRSPEEVAYDLLLADEGKNFLYAPLVNYDNYTLDASGEMLKHPNALVGLSDGGAHCGMIMDASFPTFLLSYWGKQRGLPIEELVRRQTSDTARAMGLTDRGLLKVGMKADINVIDFDALALERPVIQFDLPAGGKRLMQHAKGYDATIVSGVVTYRNGQPTGELPGQLVRCEVPSKPKI